jgi:hypothetical protein
MAEFYHLAVAWDWEFDREFIRILEAQIHSHRLLFYSISHHNTHETARRVQRGDLTFGSFLDRAGDTDDHFLVVSRTMRKTSAYFINPPEAIVHATDKATMHLEFLTKGIDVPFSLIISPFNKRREVELTLSDLARLGRPFIIKPANTTGGGIGVITGAESLKDVIESRQHHKNDKYLLQEKICPIAMNSHKAWFRVFYIQGLIIPCWWDDETHRYALVTPVERDVFGLPALSAVTRRIHEVCKLDFFSTEIAITKEKKFVVVDYVNDVCDMRLQSRHFDGVPDQAVLEICRRIARRLRSMARSGSLPHLPGPLTPSSRRS